MAALSRAVLAGARMPLLLLLLLALLLVQTGCAFLSPQVQVAQHPEPVLAEPPPAPPPNGAIFQHASYRPLFEDHRARLPGDTLLVQIVEKVSASQKSTSSINKSGGISGAITALPAIAANSFGRAKIGATAANDFGGKGATESTNDFAGTLTVTVRQVLANGHLLVAGEKQIGVNANVDVLRFSGQIDPRSIQPGNTVQSTQIANVRLEHRGRGAQADAQEAGWLQRVFFSVVSPL